MTTDPREEIAELEARIDALAERAEHCRKLALAGDAAMWLGGAVLLLLLLGVLGRSPGALVLALAAVIGGFPLSGSNRSSMREAREAMAELEAHRAALIETLAPRPVSSGGWPG